MKSNGWILIEGCVLCRHKLEVVSLMELGEVKAVFTRAGKFIPRWRWSWWPWWWWSCWRRWWGWFIFPPRQRPGEYEFKYLKRLAQVCFYTSIFSLLVGGISKQKPIFPFRWWKRRCPWTLPKIKSPPQIDSANISGTKIWLNWIFPTLWRW